MRLLVLLLAMQSAAVTFDAGPQVLQVYDRTTRTYLPYDWKQVSRMTVVPEGGTTRFELELRGGQSHAMPMEGLQVVNSATVPHIDIVTDIYMDQVPDKVNYQTATINLTGFGEYDDADSEVLVRGRGNSSWEVSDKKPYRLKFSKKLSLCNLNKAKNYVLIANWTDPSLMQNALASQLGKMLEVPYTHTFVPVDVTFNGTYRGAYVLTNKPGINSGSVDIDEENSVMWELDIAMDEERCFYSPIFNLPVMLADPDLTDEQYRIWKDEFITMEEAVHKGRAADWVDLDEFARYILVHDIMGNHEVGHPKSVKIFKTSGGKYTFSPLWDFDSAMGNQWGTEESYLMETVTTELWLSGFMKRLHSYSVVRTAVKQHFRALMEREEEIWEFIDAYAATIKTSVDRNSLRWPRNYDWESKTQEMKDWLRGRLDYLKSKYM